MGNAQSDHHKKKNNATSCERSLFSYIVLKYLICENHRQRETREKLGPSDREEKLCDVVGRQLPKCSTKILSVSEPHKGIQEMRRSRTSSRRKFSKKDTRGNSTLFWCRKFENAIKEVVLLLEGSIRNRDFTTENTVNHTWTRSSTRHFEAHGHLKSYHDEVGLRCRYGACARKKKCKFFQTLNGCVVCFDHSQNMSQTVSFIKVTELKRTRIQELQLRIRRCPDIRAPRTGELLLRVTLMLWSPEKAPCQRKVSASRRHSNALEQTNRRNSTAISKRTKRPIPQGFLVQFVAGETLSYRVLTVRRKKKHNRRSKKIKSSSRTWGNQGFDSTRPHSSTIERNLLLARTLIHILRKKRKHWEKAARKGMNTDATRMKRRNRSITDKWSQYQIYRANQQADGQTRRGVVVWDSSAMNENKSNDPRSNSPNCRAEKGSFTSRLPKKSPAHGRTRCKKSQRKTKLLGRRKRSDEHAHAHGRGMEAVAKRRTTFIFLKFLGAKKHGRPLSKLLNCM